MIPKITSYRPQFKGVFIDANLNRTLTEEQKQNLYPAIAIAGSLMNIDTYFEGGEDGAVLAQIVENDKLNLLLDKDVFEATGKTPEELKAEIELTRIAKDAHDRIWGKYNMIRVLLDANEKNAQTIASKYFDGVIDFVTKIGFQNHNN